MLDHHSFMAFSCSCSELSQSAEVENSFLLALSELLLATLLPIRTSAHLTGTSAAVVSTHAEALLRGYVLDTRWTRSSVLLAQSLRVLSLLLFAPFDVASKDTHLTKLFTTLQLSRGTAANDDEVLRVSDSDVDAVEQAVDSAYLRGDALLRQADRLLESLLGGALAPAVPATVRQDAVTLADHALHLLRAHCGRSKLKSFAYYAAQSQEASAQARVLACKAAVQRGLAHLLAGLNDSDDNVRNACVQAVGTVTPLVLSDAEIQQLTVDERLLQAVCSAAQLPLLPPPPPTSASSANSMNSSSGCRVQTVSFADVVSALLRQTKVATDSAGFLDYLNDTLRVVCVLDPRAFEAIVRKELSPLLAAPTAAAGVGVGASAAGEAEGGDKLYKGLSRDALNEFVSGLLNHVDVLLQFACV